MNSGPEWPLRSSTRLGIDRNGRLHACKEELMRMVAGNTLIVMGVAGCGKTTIGKRLAKRIECAFVDADDHHPAENVEKMSSGVPLSDDDRWPWLDAVRDAVTAIRQQHSQVVVACSALKQAYRDYLSLGDPGCVFIYLKIAPASVRSRLQDRADHFMPATLVESQFAALEEPKQAVIVDATKPVDEIVEDVVTRLAALRSWN